jgi:hypothetical protein
MGDFFYFITSKQRARANHHLFLRFLCNNANRFLGAFYVDAIVGLIDYVDWQF